MDANKCRESIDLKLVPGDQRSEVGGAWECLHRAAIRAQCAAKVFLFQVGPYVGDFWLSVVTRLLRWRGRTSTGDGPPRLIIDATLSNARSSRAMNPTAA
jgi:hypothetical protein